MSERDELEQKIYRLRYKQEDLEYKIKQVEQQQEVEEFNLLYSYQRLENEWEECGESVPEFLDLLEEERELLDGFRSRKSELEEQFRYECKKGRDEMDEELYGLQKQLRNLEQV